MFPGHERLATDNRLNCIYWQIRSNKRLLRFGSYQTVLLKLDMMNKFCNAFISL